MSDFAADCRSLPGVLEESPAKAALGSLARRRDGDLFGALRRAAESSSSGSGTSLGCLVDPTASLPGATPELRAWASWGLIVDEIAKLGSVVEPREQFVLLAAFRLPPIPDGSTSWAANLGDRFGQLAEVRGLFGERKPLSNTPMNKAWAGALEMLAAAVTGQLGHLEGEDWRPYVEIGRKAAEQSPRRLSSDRRSGAGSPFRAPSPGAQPVFVERMLVSVVMRRRLVSRRITERDIVACEDGVDGFDVLASAGRTADLSELPVKAIWACRLSTPRAKPPAPARLRFPKVLRRGDRHHFVSETWDEDAEGWQRRIGVVVDHHGVAPGAFDDHGRPIAGLTVRVNCDPQCLPDACWWYAEETEPGRLRRPPDGDRRLLEVGDGFVEHTFEGPCQPREGYGIVFRWPHE
ncbi:hypothetical protein [Amycolatopsis sp. NPDC051716]|uniref:hypothetical protein n=1 Tax=Amycolatopsis sp. NPDC051716 TaxID=3155804 RepID=UPI003446DEDD